jgi:replicative DNA helicase
MNMQNVHTPQLSVVGTLLANPLKYNEIAEIVQPIMFSEEMGIRKAMTIIQQYERDSKAWNKSIIQQKVGWKPKNLLEFVKFSAPKTIIENAQLVREQYISDKGTELCFNYINQVKEIGYQDAYHTLVKSMEDLANITPQTKDDRPEVFLQAINSIINPSNEKGIQGITTGWNDLDQAIGGWVDGNLIIIGARPSMGKTTIMLHHAYHVALQDMPVGVISLEMTNKELVAKLIGQIAKLPISLIRSGRLNDDDKKQVTEIGNQLYDLPIHFQDFADRSKVTIDTIIDEVKGMVRRLGVKLVIIDYLQLIDYTGNQTANYEVQNISRNLKRLAKACNVPIIALAQLSRGIEQRGNKRPMMSDLRDSGSIEQDADIVIGLYRDEYYDPQTLDKGILEYIVMKDRQGGIPFTLERYWNHGNYEESATPF